MLRKMQIPLIYLFLTAITLIGFWQVSQCGFINYDDQEYVTENVNVQNGITLEAIRWAFTTGHSANWHPLTWMSHTVDVQLFGLNPRWHHLTNLLFHIANTLLLFLVFHRMTKAPCKSAFVAALFAVHPLHVESVAWVAERKDVLSTFFWMLTMAAYIHYVERPHLRNYVIVLIFFVLGLMAKPMLVTLPFVLLLLDYWPLQRFEKKFAPETRTEASKQGDASSEREPLSANKIKGKSGKKRNRQGIAPSSVLRPASSFLGLPFSILPLFREKIPLFALAALSCIVTYAVQQKGGAVRSVEEFSPSVRIANAWVSYIIYIGKTIWPNNLAVYYPHPGLWPLWQVLGAVLFIIAVTISVIRTAKRLPCLAVGWLWFTGTLVPVIGIVQVGTQGMADRYSYVPLIGLFIIVAWGIPELLKKWGFRKEALFVSSALIFPCLLIVTWIHVGYWCNSITLYDHTLKVTSNNDVMYFTRGSVYAKLGDHRRAIEDFDRAIEINPKYADAYSNRGANYHILGNNRQAIEDCTKAIELNGNCTNAYNNRGVAYATTANFSLAIEDYNRAIELNPKYDDAYKNRGIAYTRLGRDKEAISDFDRAIEINPQYAEAYYNRGAAYGRLGNQRQAIDDYDRAIKINPKLADAYKNRGDTYGALGNYKQAIEDYSRAIELNSKYADAYNNRGAAYGMLDNFKQAIEDFDKAVEINPKYADAYKNRGVAYDKLGNFGQAIEDMKTAAKLDNEDAKNYLRSHAVNWQPGF